MLEIQRALKRVIERFIENRMPLLQDAVAGNTYVEVPTTRRFLEGEWLVVYSDESGSPVGEAHQISRVCGTNLLELGGTLEESYNTTTGNVKKLLGYTPAHQTFMSDIYLGEPDVIREFPAITINATNRSSEWLTLESTKETYEIDITVYVLAAMYEFQYEQMHAYIKAIENALYRSFYPLVEPYLSTTLAEDYAPGDTVIRITDEDLFTRAWGVIFLENYDFLRSARLLEYHGHGVYDLKHPIGKAFSAGDTVVCPLRHIFDSRPHGTRYGTVNKGTMLKAGVVSWRGSEEVRRYVPYIDPLTF
jgi:hypothetical protein